MIVSPKNVPTFEDALVEMKKARDVQKQKIQNYLIQNINLHELKIKKKESLETDEGSIGSPRKRVKKIKDK